MQRGWGYLGEGSCLGGKASWGWAAEKRAANRLEVVSSCGWLVIFYIVRTYSVAYPVCYKGVKVLRNRDLGWACSAELRELSNLSPPSPSPPPPSPSPPPPSRTVTTLGLPADAVVLAGQRPRACPLPEALGDFSHTMLHVGARVRALRRRSAVGSKLAAGLLSTTVSEDARSRLNVRPGGTPPRSEPVSDVHKVFFPPNSSHICTQAPGNNCSALLGRSDTGGGRAYGTFLSV